MSNQGPDHELGVIVAVDGSPTSHAAVRWAARAAAIRKVPLTVVHAVAAPPATWPPGPYRDSLGERLEAEGKNGAVRATRIAEDALVADGSVPIARQLVHSNPAPALIEMSDQAELIVVGGSGRGLLAQGVLGSVSSAVARHANCPVAIIRDEALPDPKRAPVLLGVDGSPISDRATAIAFDEASRRGVDLVALQALSDAAERELPESDWAELEAEAERRLSESLAGWQERYPDVTVTRVVVRDRAARQLIARSESAQLVVIGSGMLMGSVSNAVLHCARIPVIIARPSYERSMLVDLISSQSQPGIDDALAAAKAKAALLQRLEGLPEDEQHAVLLDLVRANIVAVLKRIRPEAIDPDQAVQELVGFDSLAAVEMGNLLKSATGLALQPTVMFDYPKPAELAGYIHRELLGISLAAEPVDAEIQRVVGSIPVKRLRQAGVLELLLTLANESDGNGQSGQPTEKSIADMDLDDLVNTVLLNDDE
jgi:nucleotide-binding universal stress UspA family protein/acyl carrier protein